MAGTSLNDLMYDFLKKITSATSGSTEDMAISVLLTSIDPAFALTTQLPEGGTSGQVLSKATNTSYDTTWVDGAISLTTVPRLVYFVYGDSTDGGTTPDTTTQVSIDALLADGVPAENIRWLYLVTPTNTFAIQDLTSGSTIDNLTISLIGGSFVVSDLTSGITIDNIVITNPEQLTFVIADITSSSTIDNIVITETVAGETWNPSAKDASITLSAGNTIATATVAAWRSVLSTLAFSATDGYFEIAASGDAGAIGIGNSSAVTNNYVGSTADGVMYTPTDDKIYYNGSGVASGLGGNHGAARLTCAWQASTGKVWFGFNASPNVGGTHHGTLAGPVYAAGSLVTNGGTLELKDASGEWLYANPWG